MNASQTDADYLIIGGGFFGCALALFLRSISDRVVLVEAREDLLDRASHVNQARIHSGFHYPRSPLTAVKSHLLRRRFCRDFPSSVVDDFQMLYAIARHGSKVDAARFFRMYKNMGCEIETASPAQAALFADDKVDGVFACTEYAFDYRELRDQLRQSMDAVGVDLRVGSEVTAVEVGNAHVVVTTVSGDCLRARYVFNVTYAHINDILKLAGLPLADLKHEMTETALIDPPGSLMGYAITTMDGRFFSTMPFPPADLYSLTHVRYTPHRAWTDDQPRPSTAPASRAHLMIRDSARYVPSLQEASWRRSMFETKTILLKNESDDGRPILFHRKPHDSRVISVLGGKLDNLYDLFAVMQREEPEWAPASDRWIRQHA